MKIAWVSPLPPSPSGIGDYSADLLPEVARRAPTIAFTTEPGWRPAVASDALEVRPFEELEEALGRDHDLLPIYHQANNPWHNFVYDLAARFPGVLVLHDVVLHHLLMDRAERTGDWSSYRALLSEQYGPDGEALYELRRSKVATDLEKFLFPLSGPLIRRCLLPVVHSRHAAATARLEWPDGRFRVIPHHAGKPPEVFPLSPDQIRTRLGLDSDSPLVGCFGYITFPKEGNTLIRAFADALREGTNAYLVFVGSDQRGGEMRMLAEELRIARWVRFTGYLLRDEFYSYLNATDIVVALRYPSAGETSGTLSRALGLGRCLVTVTYGSFAEIPQSACLRVPVFGSGGAKLAEALARLVQQPGLRRSMGEASRRYARLHLSVEECAGRYVDVARSASAMRGRFPALGM